MSLLPDGGPASPSGPRPLAAAAAALTVAVLVAAFLRTAQKEVLSTELLPPVLAVTVVTVVLAVARRAVPRPGMGAIEVLMVAYLGWTLLSLAIPRGYEAVNPITGIDVELGRLVVTAVVLPFAVYQLARVALVDEQRVRWLLWTVVAMTTYSSWVAIMQFHGPAALVWPSFVVEEPSWPGRAVGVFDQPVTNGLLLVLGVVVCLLLAGRPDTGRGTRVALYVLTAAAVYSVYLTHTRAAVMGLAGAVVLGALFARGWRRGFVVIAVLGLLGLASRGAALLSPDRASGGLGSPDEVIDRLNIAVTALHAIGDHPLVGVGLGRFAMYNTYQHEAWSSTVDWSRGQGLIAHENELAIAADVGLPGLALWLGVLVGVVVLVWRALHRLPDDDLLGRPSAVTAGIALAVMIANGLTVDLRLLEFTTMLPFALTGVCVGALERRSRSTAPAPEVAEPARSATGIAATPP